MRRFSLLGSVVATLLIGMVALGSQPGAFAQEATPMVAPEMLPPFVQQWVVVWAEDPSQVATLYSDESVIEYVASGEVFQGQDEIHDLIAGEFAAFSDLRYDIRSAFVAGDWAAVEVEFSGTYTGTYPGLPPGTGQPVRLRGAVVFELEGDMIRREAHYADAYGFLIQLGALPAPEMAGTPAA
jgi:steroid delta-isomerase-like uncharacterized protein